MLIKESQSLLSSFIVEKETELRSVHISLVGLARPSDHGTIDHNLYTLSYYVQEHIVFFPSSYDHYFLYKKAFLS